MPGMRFAKSPQTSLRDSIITISEKDPGIARLVVTPREGLRYMRSFNKGHYLGIELILDSYRKDQQFQKWTLVGKVIDGDTSYDAIARITGDHTGIRIDSIAEPSFYFEAPFYLLMQAPNSSMRSTLQAMLSQN
jgi:hypothetical protein